MAYKNRYHRTLPHSQAISFVTKPVAYTTDATFDLFVANAVEGEHGIYSEAGALVAAASTITAGTKYFIALKRDGLVEKSPLFLAGTAKITAQAYVAPVKQVHTVTSIGSPTAPVAGTEYSITLIDQTPGPIPFPMAYYHLVAKTGESHTQVVTRLAAMINDTRNGQNSNGKQIATAVIANTDDIVITAKDFGTHFKVVLGDKLAENATVAQTTAMNLGSGSPEQVRLYERDSDTFKGVTHQDTNNTTAQPADFGLPTSFVDNSLTYEVVQILLENTEDSPTPVEKHFRKVQVLLFLPVGASYADITTAILGV